MKQLDKKYSVAAFLDILGYKELIIKESQEREIELFTDLKETIDFALECTSQATITTLNFLDRKYEGTEQISKRLNVKQFSDNIYFSFDYENENQDDLFLGIYIITSISCLYQRLMLGKGYFIRGGIAHGLNMVDKNFIFSTALIKAVETEKDTTYPRVTLHKGLRNVFLAGVDNPFLEFTKGLFVQDWAEQIFLNPFNYTQRVSNQLESIPQDDLVELSENMNNKQRRLVKKLNDKFYIYLDDKQFNSIARKHITNRLKKYKGKEQSVYEKYLWTRQFLNWVDNKPSELTFQYV